MPTHYASLPTQEDVNIEIIFDSDDHGDPDDNHPLLHRDGGLYCPRGLPEQPESTSGGMTVPGAYEYHDCPPSGSPLKSFPNHIGNADEEFPSAPFRTTCISYAVAGALLPTHHAHVQTNEGTQNDVLSNAAVNLNAASSVEIQAEDSEPDVVTEESTAPPVCLHPFFNAPHLVLIIFQVLPHDNPG
jgi:hypothetical protein